MEYTKEDLARDFARLIAQTPEHIDYMDCLAALAVTRIAVEQAMMEEEAE